MYCALQVFIFLQVQVQILISITIKKLSTTPKSKSRLQNLQNVIVNRYFYFIKYYFTIRNETSNRHFALKIKTSNSNRSTNVLDAPEATRCIKQLYNTQFRATSNSTQVRIRMKVPTVRHRS